MTGLIQVLGVVLGVLLISVGTLEAFFIRDQRLHRFFLVDPDDVDTVRLWTLNVGLYNVIWGLGAITGSLLLGGADPAQGRTLLLFVCTAHVILGIVLFFTERRLWLNALAEAVLPVIIIVLLFA